MGGSSEWFDGLAAGSESHRCLEYPLRDVVLPFLVPQVHWSDPWEWDQPADPNPVTIDTIDSIRRTSNSWRHLVEGTAEWRAINLARHEFDQLVPPVWTPEKEFVLLRFEEHRSLFTKTWILQGPLPTNRWRITSFASLTVQDLGGLRLALEDLKVEWVDTPVGSCHEPSPTLWVTPTARAPVW